jgi:hypothetical protein
MQIMIFRCDQTLLERADPNFPYQVNSGVNNIWYWTANGQTFPTLPTLNECSIAGLATLLPTPPAMSVTNLDFWTNAPGHRIADNAINAGVDGTRVADDVILNNVVGFDVKVWDPDYVDPVTGAVGGYVDLGYPNPINKNDRFSWNGRCPVNRITPTYLQNPTYDTWSTEYESETIPGLGGIAGQATNGLDDGGVAGIVDDAGELRTSPPYPYPLRGIQVKIRAFEPDSRQVREVTVVQDFLPQ